MFTAAISEHKLQEILSAINELNFMEMGIEIDKILTGADIENVEFGEDVYENLKAVLIGIVDRAMMDDPEETLSVEERIELINPLTWHIIHQIDLERVDLLQQANIMNALVARGAYPQILALQDIGFDIVNARDEQGQDILTIIAKKPEITLADMGMAEEIVATGKVEGLDSYLSDLVLYGIEKTEHGEENGIGFEELANDTSNEKGMALGFHKMFSNKPRMIALLNDYEKFLPEEKRYEILDEIHDLLEKIYGIDLFNDDSAQASAANDSSLTN